MARAVLLRRIGISFHERVLLLMEVEHLPADVEEFTIGAVDPPVGTVGAACGH
jgi:hypothetical protein